MKKFLNVLLVIILVAIIGGGVGYIGYTSLYMNHSGHNMNSATSDNQPAAGTADTGMTGSSGMNMQQNAGTTNSIGLAQTNIVLQNKENLDKTIATFNEALRLMTVDPYGSIATNQTTNSSEQEKTTAPAPSTQSPTGQGGTNTTINVFPPSGNSGTASGNTPQSGAIMQSMGTTYDPAKMEQLHNGLYKISVGMALLDQLDNQLVSQAQNSGTNTQDPVQYYINQFNLTVANKNKLNQALTYINESANLININPYVSSNGLVYDQDRMTQVHQSVFKFAQGVVALNALNDEFTRQTVSLSNTAQNYINNANMSSMNMSQPDSSLLGGIFKNVNINGVINIVLILFVVGLIIGILGFMFSLLKPRPQPDIRANNSGTTL